MRPITWNIIDFINRYGEERVQLLIASFSTKRESDEAPLNPDIDNFLKKNAIQFSKESKSITYLVCDEEDGSLLGYFALTHKAIEVPYAGLSKTAIRELERHSHLHKILNAYVVSAFLIAQLGKNYQVDDGKRISGDELMKLANNELLYIKQRIGGGIKYLDCEADAKLIKFYQAEQNFKLFGERISERDGKRYLQYLKFM